MKVKKRYAGVLPFAKHKGTIYFLLGRERFGDAAGLYSDFGGKIDKNESIGAAAAREVREELYPLVLATNWQKSAGFFESPRARHYLCQIKYNSNLPLIFAHHAPVYAGIYSPYLEKDKLIWVNANKVHKLKNLRPEFRHDLQFIERLQV
jgi:8-oxo-dGTP pyrophosphatase MutT (NUDIX family)